MISFSFKLDGDISELYDQSLNWIRTVEGETLSEIEYKLIKATNYRTIEGKIPGELVVQFNVKENQVGITISLSELGSTPRFLFQKYKDLPNVFLIEGYILSLNLEMKELRLKQLYSRDLINDSIIGSLFFSLGYLIFAAIGIYSTVDLFPSLLTGISSLMVIVMVYFAYPHLYSFYRLIYITRIR